jgi:hypothetical protein
VWLIKQLPQYHYHFHDEWEIEYLFVVVKDKCCCLICNASVSLPKKGILKECFLEIADNLFEGFKNKKEFIATIRDFQLSRNTIVRRIEMI